MNNSEANLTIYRPSYWRCLLTIYEALLLTMLILGSALFLLSNYTGRDYLESIISNGFFFMLLGPFFAAGNRERAISLSSHYVIGKKYMGLGRIGFHINEIDRERSNKRSLCNKLFGTQYIYSNSGDKILFERRHFTKQQREEIFNKLTFDSI